MQHRACGEQRRQALQGKAGHAQADALTRALAPSDQSVDGGALKGTQPAAQNKGDEKDAGAASGQTSEGPRQDGHKRHRWRGPPSRQGSFRGRPREEAHERRKREERDSGNEADETDSDGDAEAGKPQCDEFNDSQGSVGQPDYCGRALYAEERRHVSIIFSDVVKFSRIVDGAPASKVCVDGMGGSRKLAGSTALERPSLVRSSPVGHKADGHVQRGGMSACHA